MTLIVDAELREKASKFLFAIAHPEPTSFTAELARHGMRVLEQTGQVVDVADLYGMSFDPVSDRRNFIATANAARYDQQMEEKFASANSGYSSDLQREMDRLATCDVLILQFPIWWLGMPAIMKGWIDRVFAIGVTYGGGRWFDRGMMRGKRAMLAVTIGGTEEAYSSDGIYGSAADVLRPINHGILAFCGFDVLEPFIAYAPARKSELERQQIFAAYADRLLNLNAVPRLPMLRSDDYENFVLKARR
jgi:NAD(P)H dehydrogenase (quinone)